MSILLLWYWFVICRLFIYKIPDTSTDNSKDLTLEYKLPVDTTIAFNIGTSFILSVFAVYVYVILLLLLFVCQSVSTVSKNAS